ncbi:MAG: aminopeptidase P family protein [Puniceicoccaceae bacterium]|nr:MAG: aminopeptidase P family protein [Puniceicoccaceae bacterium]
MPAATSSASLPKLLYADTVRSSDQAWFSGFRVPDAFISLEHRGTKRAWLNALEYGRALKESAFDEVLPLEKLQEAARRRTKQDFPGAAEVIFTLARELGLKGCRIPTEFPAGIALVLKQKGLRLEVVPDPFFPQRLIKTEAEAAAIAAGNRISTRGFRAAEDLLRRATIKGRRLRVDGRPLTSERVRKVIQAACLEAGGIALDTIVAGGDQACDPHCTGSGPLRPGELIIIDIFPKSLSTGFHGDMTRTYVKGRPSEAQKALVAAVAEAQKLALSRIRAGVDGARVHQAVCAFFEQHGYATRHGDKGSEGFFHGTGHGLGLDVHEPPRVSRMRSLLPAGTVVTVEPGLYYPGLGGCRIEDVVQVTKQGPKMLSRHPYRWVFS